MGAMYLKHFGLKEVPFSLAPNAGYFLNIQGYQDALNTLLVGLENCDSFIKVTGEVGTGKTLLCRKLIASVDSSYHVVYLRTPSGTDMDLFAAVAQALQIPDALHLQRPQLLTAIDHKLTALQQQGQRCLLLMDEAQAMSLKALEALRFLCRSESDVDKLQVVLFGQPELDEKLSSPKLRQLKQRIVFSCRLKPMDRESLGLYIHHRLFVAGFQGDVLFAPKSLDRMFSATQGVPRLVNIVAHKSLLVAYGRGARRISEVDVDRAVRDTEQLHENSRNTWWALLPDLQVGLAVLAVCTLGIYGYQHFSF